MVGKLVKTFFRINEGKYIRSHDFFPFSIEIRSFVVFFITGNLTDFLNNAILLCMILKGLKCACSYKYRKTRPMERDL